MSMGMPLLAEGFEEVLSIWKASQPDGGRRDQRGNAELEVEIGVMGANSLRSKVISIGGSPIKQRLVRWGVVGDQNLLGCHRIPNAHSKQ